MADGEGGAIQLSRADTLLGDELCVDCDLLKLSANNFLVSNAGRSVPRFHSANSKFSLNSGLGKKSLGKISEIQQKFERSGCALCRLVFQAAQRYSGQNLDDDSECFMVWEVDGRRAARQPDLATKPNGNAKDDKQYATLFNVSRRLKIWWMQKDGSEMDAHILFLASSDKVSLRLHTGIQSNLQDLRHAVFLGRDFDVAQPKSALFKGWLDTCENQHKSRPCNTDYVYDAARFVELVQKTWFGVIDVDSGFSWELNAAVMDLVYGNAYLTICAADGQNDEAGLHALDLETADTPLKAELRNGLRVLVSRPSESIIRDSTWNQRGWTFQERILSRRCLVFAGGRVYFQCRSGNMSQDIAPDTSGHGLSMDWKTSPLRTLEELKERPIWFYMTSVSLYTGRRLTLAKDILNAYKGVSGLIAPHIQGPVSTFVYGLPPSHFDLAILWSPLKAQTRRKPSNNHDAKEIDLPSWSWAGWKDLHDEKKGSPVKYQQDMLDGCLIDTHEWLSKHTWIKWFIRNSDGDLCPIWDKYSMPKVEGVLDRWRGYATNAESYLPSMLYNRWASNSSDDKSTDVSIHGAEPTIRLIKDERRDPQYRVQQIESQQHHQHEHALPHRNGTPRPEPQHQHGVEIVHVSDPPNMPSTTENITSEFRSTTETEETNSTMTERHEYRDEYGRQSRWPRNQLSSRSFSGSIPDNPFGVRVVAFDDDVQRRDRPILQFWTWRARFFVVHNEEATKASPPGDGLVRCDIADDNADWCGHIVLNESYIKAKESTPRMEFIALSDAKSFTKEECPNWAHYIPKSFDDIEWDLFFVMLVEWDKILWRGKESVLGKLSKLRFV